MKWLKLQWHYFMLGVTDIPDTHRWWRNRWNERQANRFYRKDVKIHAGIYSDLCRIRNEEPKGATFLGLANKTLTETRRRFNLKDDWMPKQ